MKTWQYHQKNKYIEYHHATYEEEETRGSLTLKKKRHQQQRSHNGGRQAMLTPRTQTLLTGSGTSSNKHRAHKKTKKQMQSGRETAPTKEEKMKQMSTYEKLAFYIIKVKDIYALSPHLLGAPAKTLGAPSNTPKKIHMLAEAHLMV